MLSTETLPPERVVPCLRSIGLMLDSGTKLHEALTYAYLQTQDGLLQKVLADVHGAVARGKPLAHAMEAHPKQFPRALCLAVRAGEDSGSLGAVLRCLSEHYGEERRTREQLLGTVVYPLTVSLVFLAVVTFLFLFILPKLVRIHALHSVELPWLTAALIQGCKLLFSPLGIVGLVAAFGVLLALVGTAEGRGQVERFMQRLPLIGPTLRSGRVARFCGLLSILLKGGMPLTEALSRLASRLEDRAFSRSVAGLGDRILRGEAFAVALRDSRILPEDVVRLLHAGAETNRLEPLLDEAAQMHRDLVAGRSKMLLSIAEPAFILVLGVFVALVVIAMYLPLIRLTTTFVGSF